MSALAVSNLHVSYGNIRALRGVSLAVAAGTICAVVGANGAGKTTTLNAICGLRTLSAGRVVLDGQDVTEVPPHDLVPLGLVQVPEGRRVFSRLTVQENLGMGAFRRRAPRGELAAELDRVLELFPRLRERMRQLAGTLSGGEQQMLAIGRALMSRPRTLLMDEPSMGLAPQVADTAYVLQSGEVVLAGPGPELLNSDAVREAYLG